MFVGHLAVAMVAKRASPSLSLGWFVAAATALDLLWPIFVLTGIERVSIVPGATPFTPFVFDYYPWSHSLLMSVVWGAVLAGIARWRRASVQDAMILGALVVSHWVLDFITHAPDLPLWPGDSPKLGLGLWNSIAGTLVIEGLLWVVAIVVYLAPRRARDWQGPVAFWSFVLISTGMWVAGPWSEPPPSTQALGWFSLIGWIVIPWAAWADRHYALRVAE
jgi:hypothetical protein